MSVEPSKTLGIFKVIIGIFLIGFAIYTYLYNYDRYITFLIAFMGILSVASGICEFDSAKRERKMW